MRVQNSGKNLISTCCRQEVEGIVLQHFTFACKTHQRYECIQGTLVSHCQYLRSVWNSVMEATFASWIRIVEEDLANIPRHLLKNLVET